MDFNKGAGQEHIYLVSFLCVCVLVCVYMSVCACVYVYVCEGSRAAINVGMSSARGHHLLRGRPAFTRSYQQQELQNLCQQGMVQAPKVCWPVTGAQL
jgi:hypothetical protein